MTKRQQQIVPRPASQLPMAFTVGRRLDERQRADAVVLLSKLLLQVAANHGEVVDERA